jgi:hypothetical protein
MKLAAQFAPAFTLRSAMASVVAMLGTATLINYVHVILVAHTPGEHSLVIPGLWVFLALLGGCALVSALCRFRLLTRPELLCVLYTILLSGPMMSQGFWHRVVAISSTIPRTGDFEKMDAFSDKLWPAGPNLLQGTGFRPDERIRILGPHRHEIVDHTVAKGEEIVVLENESAAAMASIRFRVPVQSDVAEGVMPGTPYLISALLRPENLDGDSRYFIRLIADDESIFTEVLHARTVRPRSVIHPEGFQREGGYGITAPEGARDSITVEIGLQGPGTLFVADPQLRSVLAMEQVFTGRRLVSESEFAALPAHQRHGLVVRPDNLLSFAGVQYLLTGFVPWDAWWRPILAWGGMLTLVLLGTLSVAVIMRRKWIDSERFSLPLTRIPTMIIGEPGESEKSFLSDLWRNRVMWIGFGLGALWCGLKLMSFYNSAIPDPGIEVPIGPYFGPEWGETWNITFAVFAIFVSIAIFLELNILLSLVVGFFLFRLLFWYGYVSGLDASPGFPYSQEQQIGAYLTYAFLLLWFSRKYLAEVIKEACSANPPQRGEIFSYRTALCLLLGVVAGSAIWARWVEVSVPGMLLFMAFLLTIGFVAMRIRAECGVPFGYFTPYNAALIIMLAGGIGAFGPQLVVFAFVATFFITVAGFFLIPGAQLELLELGRRYGIQPRHILCTCLIGILGGVVIGGWSFLSSSYALGGDSMRYDWAYLTKPWYFQELNRELSQASLAAEEGASNQLAQIAPTGMEPSTYGYLFGAIGTAILTILRQIFAGFWLHPVGFIVGSTLMMGAKNGALWGSILTAWAIRLLVVKIGGAETVRTKLLPFFAGVFLAAVVVTLLGVVYASYLRSQGVEIIFQNFL